MINFDDFLHKDRSQIIFVNGGCPGVFLDLIFFLMYIAPGKIWFLYLTYKNVY